MKSENDQCAICEEYSSEGIHYINNIFICKKCRDKKEEMKLDYEKYTK